MKDSIKNSTAGFIIGAIITQGTNIAIRMIEADKEIELARINSAKAKIEVVMNHNNDIEKEVYPVKRVERNPSTK